MFKSKKVKDIKDEKSRTNAIETLKDDLPPRKNYFFSNESIVTLSNLTFYDEDVNIEICNCNSLVLHNCYFQQALFIWGNVDTIIFNNTKAEAVYSHVTCNHLLFYANSESGFPCVRLKENTFKNLKSVVMHGTCITFENPFDVFCIDLLQVTNSKLEIDCSTVNCTTFSITNSIIHFENFQMSFAYRGKQSVLKDGLCGLNFKKCMASNVKDVTFFGDKACFINETKYDGSSITDFETFIMN